MGAKLGFDHTPRMFYRQYAYNVARVLQPFNELMYRLRHQSSRSHRCLLRDEQKRAGKMQTALVEFSSAEAFNQSICSSAETLRRYIHSLNRMAPTGGGGA